MERAVAAQGAAWLQWRNVAGKEHKRERQRRRRGRRGRRKKKDQGSSRQRSGCRQKVSVHDGEKDDVKTSVEQSYVRSWDCSQIENEEESWRGRDQMAAQWDE